MLSLSPPLSAATDYWAEWNSSTLLRITFGVVDVTDSRRPPAVGAFTATCRPGNAIQSAAAPSAECSSTSPALRGSFGYPLPPETISILSFVAYDADDADAICGAGDTLSITFNAPTDRAELGGLGAAAGFGIPGAAEGPPPAELWSGQPNAQPNAGGGGAGGGAGGSGSPVGVLDELLEFSPPIGHVNISGQWQSDAVLVLTVHGILAPWAVPAGAAAAADLSIGSGSGGATSGDGSSETVDSGSGVVDSGSGVVDSGSGVVDSGSGAPDGGSGALDGGRRLSSGGGANSSSSAINASGSSDVNASGATDAGSGEAGSSPPSQPPPLSLRLCAAPARRPTTWIDSVGWASFGSQCAPPRRCATLRARRRAARPTSPPLSGDCGLPPQISAFTAADADDSDAICGIGDTLTIAFDRATDQPPAQTRLEIDRLFTFSQALGNGYTGAWTDTSTLVVTLLETYLPPPQLGVAVASLRGPLVGGATLLRGANHLLPPSSSSSPPLTGSCGRRPRVSSLHPIAGPTAGGSQSPYAASTYSIPPLPLMGCDAYGPEVTHRRRCRRRRRRRPPPPHLPSTKPT